jgi:hypothetical protein
LAALSVASWLDLAEPPVLVDCDAPVVLLDVSPFALLLESLALLAACAEPPFFGNEASCDSSALISALSWSMAVVVLLELDDDEPPPPPPPPLFEVEVVDVVLDVLLDDDASLEELDEVVLLLPFDVVDVFALVPLAVVATAEVAELVG